MSSKQPALSDPVDLAALGLSLSRLLVRPLAALRASIEALGEDVDHGALSSRQLDSTLEEVNRLARDVQSLVELAAPATLTPLSCSLEEVVHAAVRLLSAEQRARVRCARAIQEAQLDTDGPVLSRCLAYVLQAALATSSEAVLLRADGGEGDRASFTVVCSGSIRAFEPHDPRPDEPSTEVALAVRMAVARRDIKRLGGRLEVHPSERGLVCAVVELPSDPQAHSTRKEGRR